MKEVMGVQSVSFAWAFLEQQLPPPSPDPSRADSVEDALSKDTQHFRRPHKPFDLESESDSRAVLDETVLKDLRKEEQHRVFPQAPIPSRTEVYSRGLICRSSTRPRYFP